MDNSSKSEWKTAITLISEWEKDSGHLDELLDKWDPGKVRWLVMEVFRNWLIIESILEQKIRKEPRPLTRNLLRLSLGELLDRDIERHSRIVHHAVEMGKSCGLSKSECGFVNGVLRSIIRDWTKISEYELRKTHPDWLLQRWENQFGEAATRELIQWNQSVPKLMIRANMCPGYASKSKWEGYFSINPGRFPEALVDLNTGKVYIQDPFTRIPVDLLSIQKNESVLDICAAPGGKTRLLAEALSGTGFLMAVDKPGTRLGRLEQNVARMGFDNIHVKGIRLEDLDPDMVEELNGGRPVDAVLIDVPCSNTGVIQKRPDVKLRLGKDVFKQHAEQQMQMLEHAAKLIRSGGRMVYSTCSIDTEENSGVVERFLMHNPHWSLSKSVISYPWECEHDGGAAFLLTKSDRK